MQELTKEQKFIALVAANPSRHPHDCALDRAAAGLGIVRADEELRLTIWLTVAERLGLSRSMINGIMNGWDTMQFPDHNIYKQNIIFYSENAEYIAGYGIGVHCWNIAYPNKGE